MASYAKLQGAIQGDRMFFCKRKEVILLGYIGMFKIIKGIDNISAEEFFSIMESDRNRGHSFRVKKRRERVTMVVRQVFYSHNR